jgi:rhamnogalacturonyl hydrolase YesR
MKGFIALVQVVAICWVTCAFHPGAGGAQQALPLAAFSSATTVGSDDLPRHSDVVAAGELALKRGWTVGPAVRPVDSQWLWGTYFAGALRLYQEDGNEDLTGLINSAGRASNWSLSASGTNPDTNLVMQPWYSGVPYGVSPELAGSDRRMAADLLKLQSSSTGQYYWIDSLFMGLPNWSMWATRTGDSAYRARGASLYDFAKSDGYVDLFGQCDPAIHNGLLDPATKLWFRDCRYVPGNTRGQGSTEPNGEKKFWSRGQGWVIAAMANMLQVTPTSDASYGEYQRNLVEMAGTLAAHQPTDGMWRTSILDPDAYNKPEVTGTSLIVYAMAYGVRTGILDKYIYVPKIAKAWNAMTSTLLEADGDLKNCQLTADAPNDPLATDPLQNEPYCAGTFALAAAEVAKLTNSVTTNKTVTATSSVASSPAANAVDGAMNTRWQSAGTFPQSLTVDLGGRKLISNTMVAPAGNRKYRYKIDRSTDGKSYFPLVDRTANTLAGPFVDVFPLSSAAYLRLTITGVYGGGSTKADVKEFGVYDRYDPRTNLAAARPVTATSGASPTKAADNVLSTAWTSTAVPTTQAPQSLVVDLGTTRRVDTVRLHSPTTAGLGPKDVKVLVSTTGATSGFTEQDSGTLANASGPHDFFFPAVSARWVKLKITSSYSSTKTSVAEVGVF